MEFGYAQAVTPFFFGVWDIILFDVKSTISLK